MAAPRDGGAALQIENAAAHCSAAESPSQGPAQVSEAAAAWERVRDFAVSKGCWTVALTPRGRRQ
jgi:hypothetical protein